MRRSYPRDSMETAIFNNKMWVLGGWRPHSRPRVNDVWCSGDGRQWERICMPAPWEGRNLFNTLAHMKAMQSSLAQWKKWREVFPKNLVQLNSDAD